MSCCCRSSSTSRFRSDVNHPLLNNMQGLEGATIRVLVRSPAPVSDITIDGVYSIIQRGSFDSWGSWREAGYFSVSEAKFGWERESNRGSYYVDATVHEAAGFISSQCATETFPRLPVDELDVALLWQRFDHDPSGVVLHRARVDITDDVRFSKDPGGMTAPARIWLGRAMTVIC